MSATDTERIERVRMAAFADENVVARNLIPFLQQRREVCIELRECFCEGRRKELENLFDYLNHKIKDFLLL